MKESLWKSKEDNYKLKQEILDLNDECAQQYEEQQWIEQEASNLNIGNETLKQQNEQLQKEKLKLSQKIDYLEESFAIEKNKWLQTMKMLQEHAPPLDVKREDNHNKKRKREQTQDASIFDEIEEDQMIGNKDIVSSRNKRRKVTFLMHLKRIPFLYSLCHLLTNDASTTFKPQTHFPQLA